MTALATLEDVNRILGYTTGDNTARDAKVRAELAAIESWAETSLWKISAEGPNVEVYFDVVEDATLYLPAGDITVTKVKIVPYASGDDGFYFIYVNSSSSTGQGYDLDDQGRLMLRPAKTFAPFEGARGSRLLNTYARVEVHYEGTGVIPRAVTEGVAYLTAGYHAYGPKALAAIKSEKIGDYSYTLAGAGPGETLPYLDQALFFLKRFIKTQRVRVI
jgi:hypothetical protein